MKNSFKNFLSVTLGILAITACAQKVETKYYLSISHEIKDYPSWRAVFDELNPDRIKAGINDIFVKKDINNTNSVTIFSEVKNLDKSREFMSSNKLKLAMKRAGVISTPNITYYSSAEEYGLIDVNTLVTTITHSVSDFNSWKKVYKTAAVLRQNAGINDHLLLRSISDENVVTVLGTSSSAAKFNVFITDPNLKVKMEQAGVTSKPKVVVLL